MPRPPKWNQKDAMLTLRRLRNACFREGLNTAGHACELVMKCITWEKMEQALSSQDFMGALRISSKTTGPLPDEEEEAMNNGGT